MNETVNELINDAVAKQTSSENVPPTAAPPDAATPQSVSPENTPLTAPPSAQTDVPAPQSVSSKDASSAPSAQTGTPAPQNVSTESAPSAPSALSASSVPNDAAVPRSVSAKGSGDLSAEDVVAENARLAKARKTRTILVIVIIVLVVALAGLIYLFSVMFMEGWEQNQSGIKPVATTLADNELVDPNAPGEIEIEETKIPNLVLLFDLTVEGVKDKLGTDFQLTKTDSSTDETNPAIQQLATFTYEPPSFSNSEEMMSNMSLPNESIYASLDESGKVIDIYYVCDMRLLGYPEKSFDELLSGSETVSNVLASAGVQPKDFTYTAPNPDESIVYDNPNSSNRKIVKQSQIFSGRMSPSDTGPTVWTLTVTYDFGSGVASPDEFRQATRTINLKLA